MASKSFKNVFSIEELEAIKYSFEHSDRNKDKVLDIDEFKHALHAKKMDSADTQHLFTLFDTNGDGRIQYNEFITGLAVITRGTPDQKLKFLFDFYDVDHDGVLTRDEIKVLINHVKKVVANLLGPELEQQAELNAETIVMKLDINGDGKISAKEWLVYGKQNNKMLELFGLE